MQGQKDGWMDGYRFERVDWTDRTDTDRGGGGGLDVPRNVRTHK